MRMHDDMKVVKNDELLNKFGENLSYNWGKPVSLKSASGYG